MSGVVSVVMYMLTMLVHTWGGGGGVDFGVEANHGPNDRMGLILVLGVMAENGLVDMAASFEIAGCRWDTFLSHGQNMPCLTILVSLQMTFEAIMNVELKHQWPDELQAAGNLTFSCCSKTRDAKVTDDCSLESDACQSNYDTGPQ